METDTGTRELLPTAGDLGGMAVYSIRAMADGDYADVARFVHARAVNREAKDEPPGASVPGPEGFWATALWLREAFSDLHFEIHGVVRDGDLVVVHTTMSGRQTGAFVSYTDGRVKVAMPPTGRHFATTQSHWLRFADGLITEHWANRDDLGTAEQLGWVPPSPAFLVRQALATRRARRRPPHGTA